MTTKPYRIIKVRLCGQCGAGLSLKCVGCVKHPQRVPREMYTFDLPPALREGPCGCVLIVCDNPWCEEGSGKTRKAFWKTKMQAVKFEHNFCCHPCAQVANNRARGNAVVRPCDNPECDRGPGGVKNTVRVSPSRAKRCARAFCCPGCFGIWQRIQNIAAKREEGTTVCLWCNPCGAATEHVQLAGGNEKRYRCTASRGGKTCLAERGDPDAPRKNLTGAARNGVLSK